MPTTTQQVPGPPDADPPLFDPAALVAAPIGREIDALAEPVAAAVLACPAVAALSARLFGVPTGSDHGPPVAERRPRASARVTGRTTALDVRLTVAYPASVRATTEAVRAHVRDCVTALTELHVTRVDITVAALTHTTGPTRRVIQ